MWMKIDDQLHAHRKTRTVLKSDKRGKGKDAGPMGLWVLAGSWAAQNRTDGWVPTDELDRFDDDAEALAFRLVAAGYWWSQERDGEPGYGFNDWHDYNDPSDSASKAGTFGNHVRWHANEGKVDPECEHCPKEPTFDDLEPDVAPTSGGDRGAITPDIAPDSGGESPSESGAIALPVPDPLPVPVPDPKATTLSDTSDDADPLARFDEFWETYGNKVGRAKCEVAYRNALKKPNVNDDVLIAAAAAYVLWCQDTDTYMKNPLTWLHGEHWRDERTPRRPESPPESNAQGWLRLATEQAELDNVSPFRQIGGAS